jgi:hypothetical protein
VYGPAGRGGSDSAGRRAPRGNGDLDEFSQESPAAALGAWGVDAETTSIWAVVDHNSQLAVVSVPEPGTWFLLTAAGLRVRLFRLRRRGGIA